MSKSTDTLIVSVSGIRGIIGAGLSPAAALAFAQALGTYLKGGPSSSRAIRDRRA